MMMMMYNYHFTRTSMVVFCFLFCLFVDLDKFQFSLITTTTNEQCDRMTFIISIDNDDHYMANFIQTHIHTFFKDFNDNQHK